MPRTTSRTVIDRLAVLPTAAISDALDKLALPGPVPNIAPLLPGRRACGPAFTVAYDLSTPAAARSATSSTMSRPARSSSSTTRGGPTPRCGAAS